MSRADSLSILLVDDSAFFLSLISDKLETNYGMATTSAANAEEAMAALEEGSFDCIVSDYKMPGTSGLELYEAVDAEYDLPFILLTAEGDESIASDAIRRGIDEYLMKQAVREEDPLDLLVNRIRNVVSQRRTQRKYELLVDNSPDEIAQLDTDGVILAANESMATAHGADREALVGSHLSEVLPADVAATRIEEGTRALAIGSAVTFQDSIGVRHFHNVAVPLSSVGEEDSIQLVTREITHQKRHERELERKSEKLTLINRIVRHDINNDVQLQMAWADALQDHVDPEGREYVDRLRDTSDHIAELTAIARDFVESLEDDTEMALDPIAVGRVLEREIEKARDSHEATFHATDVPQVTVRANELLSSVFANLLTNAVRHNDSADPRVWVDVAETDTAVAVRVADDGPGVPDDRKEEIFGKGSMGPESPGTGVGLYLVHTLVDQYGGSVTVEDWAGEPPGAEGSVDGAADGAVFVVELPKHSDGGASFP